MSSWPIRVEVRVLQFLEHEFVSFASIWRPKVILMQSLKKYKTLLLLRPVFRNDVVKNGEEL